MIYEASCVSQQNPVFDLYQLLKEDPVQNVMFVSIGYVWNQAVFSIIKAKYYLKSFYGRGAE